MEGLRWSVGYDFGRVKFDFKFNLVGFRNVFVILGLGVCVVLFVVDFVFIFCMCFGSVFGDLVFLECFCWLVGLKVEKLKFWGSSEVGYKNFKFCLF